VNRAATPEHVRRARAKPETEPKAKSRDKGAVNATRPKRNSHPATPRGAIAWNHRLLRRRPHEKPPEISNRSPRPQSRRFEKSKQPCLQTSRTPPWPHTKCVTLMEPATDPLKITPRSYVSTFRFFDVSQSEFGNEQSKIGNWQFLRFCVSACLRFCVSPSSLSTFVPSRSP